MTRTWWRVAGLGLATGTGLITLGACVGSDPVLIAAAGGADAAVADRDVVTSQDASTSADDASTHDAASADASDDVVSAARKCATLTPPPAPNDFFCADFDGVSLDEGWTRMLRPDAGTMSLTQDIFSSAPNALIAAGMVTESLAQAGSMLEWDKVGATTIRSIDLRFAFNPALLGGVPPPSNGFVDLATIEAGGTGGAKITYMLRQTRGRDVAGTGPHVGYFLTSSFVGGAAISSDDVIDTSPAPGAFTTVRLVVTADGQVQLFFNGVKVFEKNAYSFTETRARIGVGAATTGPSATKDLFRFDDVVIQINRD